MKFEKNISKTIISEFNNANKTKISSLEATSLVTNFSQFVKVLFALDKRRKQLLDEGFIYKNTQHRIYRSQLEHILKNPFYYVMISFKNEIYQGVHIPLITKELFDKPQNAFRKDNKPKYFEPLSFLFGGMLKCANCWCIISGEMKKGGKYIYYSCTGAKGPCEQKHKYIREGIIERQIIQAFEKIRIDEKQK